MKRNILVIAILSLLIAANCSTTGNRQVVENPAEQNRLGEKYLEEGKYELAAYWFRKAADQGLVDAQYNLGFCYYGGIGVKQDYEHAVYWYRKAADQGDAAAQYFLGAYYTGLLGFFIKQDYEQVVYWWTKAADQGDVTAQYFLGTYYYEGRGVPQDYEQAAYWFRKAADQGDNEAANALDELRELGY